MLLSGCFGEDIPVLPYQPDGTTISELSLGRDYNQQLYYSLSMNSIVGSNYFEDYDFAFASSVGEYTISTNPAALLRGADLGVVPIDFELDYESKVPLYLNGDSIEFKNELYTGVTEDYIMGKWWVDNTNPPDSKSHTYLFTLGLDSRARVKGYVRLKVDSIDAKAYYCRFGNLRGDSIWHVNIPKKPFINNVFYSIENGIQELEPISTEWDMFFTRFNDFAPDINLDSFDYSVVGVLINQKRILAQDIHSSFSDFTLAEAKMVQYTDTMNVIGYDWKSFDIDNDIYNMRDSIFYSIKTSEGIYYKLRFTSFVDSEGIRGSPRFEYIKL